MLMRKPQAQSLRFPWKISLSLYGISFAPQFLSFNTLFWDDWTMFEPISRTLRNEVYTGTGGGPWRTFFETQILMSSPLLFRLCTFLCFFWAGYFLFHTLSKIPFLSVEQITAITLIFMVLPVNSARISLITNGYAVSYFLFFLAWFLFEEFENPFMTVGSYIAFFLSFSMISFPVFAIIPVLLSLVIAASSQKRMGSLFWTRISILSMLPIAYLVLRQMYWPPSGGSAVMYDPQLLGLLRAILFTSIFSLPLLYGSTVYRWKSTEIKKYLVSFGIFSLAIGAFPYMVGGHLVDISDWLIGFIPNHSDWNSRHQLLLPLGFALIIGGSLRLDTTKPLRWNSSPVLSTIIACCVILNVTFAQEYFLDGKKQDSIMAAMADNEDLKYVSSILIDDTAVRFNARGRLIRSYEWEGMMQKVFGDDSRKVSYLQYVNCAEFKPDSILRISAPNGRLESTLRGNVAINISVEKINPCGN
jgi:hypothetical protein